MIVMVPWSHKSTKSILTFASFSPKLPFASITVAVTKNVICCVPNVVLSTDEKVNAPVAASNEITVV